MTSCSTCGAALLALVLLLSTAVAQDIKFGVVEQNPVRAQLLAAAVEAALQVAVENATADTELQQEESPIQNAVSVLAAPVEPDEPLALPVHVCAQASDGVTAVVAGAAAGPRAAVLVGAAAGRAGLPLLLVDPAPTGDFWEALPFYPHPDVIAQACAALCEAKGWRRAVLLHEGGPRGAALLAPDDEPLALLARRLPPLHDTALLRNLLLVLKKSGETNFIVWCEAECAVRVLDAAQRVGLLAERHSYIVLALDLHTQPLDEFSHGGANITGLQLFDPESPVVRRALNAWRVAYKQRLGDGGEMDESEAERIAAAPPTALLLAYDAAGLTAEALLRLGPTATTAATAGDCERGLGALHADSLLNYLRSEEWIGTCGVTSWGADGARRDVQLQLVELQRGGRLQAAGVWAPRGGITWQRHDSPARPPPRDAMTNRTFTILIAENKPYVMRQESTDRLAGNERYEGFCIELIDRLSQLLNFNYTFIEQPDGKYGSLNNVTHQWDGMTRRLMDDPNVDFAITDLTITAEREQAVDFTTPFMNLGIGILFRTPKAPEPEIFAFLLPFSNGVWLCLGLSYVGTSLLLYVVGRLCPEEWQNPYPCVEEPPALENQFTLANALWFNLGAVLLQGSEIAPVAYGTRAVASVWWLFALVITSSYTANLATLLAKKTSTETIQNVRELAYNELGITYGAKAGGSTYTFFEHSQSPLYQKMFEHMRNQKMPERNEDGIAKVMKEDYAFLMESTTIEYTIERNCEVTKVGGLLDSKGYGIAMKKNSPYRQALNLALLNLQEAGVLREMKHKWWNEKHGGGACKEIEERESEELSMRNFLGLFLVLVVGCAMGIVVSCCDLAWATLRRSRELNEPFTHRFWAELRFVFRFEQSVKPLRGSLTPSLEDSPRPMSQGGYAGEEEPGSPARLRSGSLHSAGAWARRRSSMHAASVRLARHAAAARDSSTPAPRQ